MGILRQYNLDSAIMIKKEGNGFSERTFPINISAIIISHNNNRVCTIMPRSPLMLIISVYRQKAIEANEQNDVSLAETYKKQIFNCLNKVLKIVKEHFPKNSTHIKRILERCFDHGGKNSKHTENGVQRDRES